MDALYWVFFSVLAAVVAVLLLAQLGTGTIVPNNGPLVAAFTKLRNNYIFVYMMMMGGDWLQGPYVYALYSHYGYGLKDIGRLFIAGFGASMLVGTVVGSLADKHGRKKAAMLYVVLYMLSCFTKHSPNFVVLMLGRVFGGVATSLLFSVFESWIVAEHFSRGFDEKWLGDTFSKAVFLGNGLIAILAGLVANFLVDNWQLGPVAPFDASATVLAIGGVVILLTWGENYGDAKSQVSLSTQFKAAAAAILGDTRIALLGAMQSFFEAAMYTFVFLWTPALSPAGELIHHGMIFACFMTASMAGSSLAPILMKRSRPETYMKYVFAVGALSLLVPFVYHTSTVQPDHLEISRGSEKYWKGMQPQGWIQLAAFCVFEVVVGLFWPSMMTMRAHYLPEDLRSTILNCFRIPLNLFVCIILYNVHLFPLSAMFGLCTAFLTAAVVCMVRLEALVNVSPIIRGMPETDPLMGVS